MWILPVHNESCVFNSPLFLACNTHFFVCELPPFVKFTKYPPMFKCNETCTGIWLISKIPHWETWTRDLCRSDETYLQPSVPDCWEMTPDYPPPQAHYWRQNLWRGAVQSMYISQGQLKEHTYNLWQRSQNSCQIQHRNTGRSKQKAFKGMCTHLLQTSWFPVKI